MPTDEEEEEDGLAVGAGDSEAAREDSYSAMRFSAATRWRPARELEARAFL